MSPKNSGPYFNFLVDFWLHVVLLKQCLFELSLSVAVQGHCTDVMSRVPFHSVVWNAELSPELLETPGLLHQERSSQIFPSQRLKASFCKSDSFNRRLTEITNKQIHCTCTSTFSVRSIKLHNILTSFSTRKASFRITGCILYTKTMSKN